MSLHPPTQHRKIKVRFLAVTLVMFLSCLSLWPSRGPEPAKPRRIAATVAQVAEVSTKTKLSLRGENARAYLEQTGEGKSLKAAVAAARFGWKRPFAIQPDGRIVVQYGVASSTPIVRLNVDGSFDPSFNSGTAIAGPARALILQPDGRILIGGAVNINGTVRTGVARLNANGSLDSSFVPNFDSRRSVGATRITTRWKNIGWEPELFRRWHRTRQQTISPQLGRYA